MRAGWLVLAIAACGPKAANTPRTVDDDLESGLPRSAARSADPPGAERMLVEPAPPPSAGPRTTGPPPGAEIPDTQRTVAPPGKGLRSGTIARDHLLAVLDAGPGSFLRQFEVAPRLAGDRFIGWELVQLLDHTGPLHDVDLASGDVLLAVNGSPLSRPEQLQTVWDSLRTANEVTARFWRGDKKFELHFTIEPQVR